ncbi:MAG: Glu/Leu/Phe/Val dehydrogenase dimerization domain-containing protein [Planctomycetota bacterium]
MHIERIPVDGYEQVVKATDAESGLRAFIAIHDTTLGPALGGMRMWPYDSEKEALSDVLRLSQGMTYKSAIARTGLGGGKSVVIGDPHKDKTPQLLQAMGRFVDSLGGRYITAEDVGISEHDLAIVRQETRFVTGLHRESGSSGNPSPYTAYGVFLGVKACVQEADGNEDLTGKRVALQGLGQVGTRLVEYLQQAGAHVIVTDIGEKRVREVVESLGVESVSPTEIYDVDCDIFAPCALGAVINDETIPRLKCRIVAGAANNQLLAPEHGDRLLEKGILYAPDYVINAGGIINVSVELLEGGYHEDVALAKIRNIHDALLEIFQMSREQRISTDRAALQVAQQRLAEGRGAKARQAPVQN